MPIMTVGTGRSLYNRNYNELVMSTGPIAYWPQHETNGTNAACLTDSAMDGTQSSDVGTRGALDRTGPFGMSAPFYDGANDYCNVSSAVLQAAWDAGGAEWSIMCWWRVFNAGVWTDGAARRPYYFNDAFGADEALQMKVAGAANQMYHQWTGGGVTEAHTEAAILSTGWNCSVMTRSETADEVKYYRNTALLATDTTIGNWASAAPWAVMLIGARTTGPPTHPWHGWEGPVGLWNRALTPGEIAGLYV